MKTEKVHFHWADYLAFTILLAISAGIGIFYGIKDRKKKSDVSYLLANRDMAILPVSLSLFVSWLSAISFLSDPIQVYNNGIMYWYIGIGYSLGVIPVAFYFGPKLHRLKLVSFNEYLKSRFNTPVAIFSCVVVSWCCIIFLGLALYAPSLALSQVADLDVWISILLVGAVATFYTSLGGMKAVLWTDTIQFFVMIAGMLAVMIRGIIVTGGINRIWKIAQEGNRLNFDKIDVNPFQYGTLWTFLFGGFVRVMNPYAGFQTFLQRYATLPSERAVTIALLLNVPLYFFIVCLFAMTGLVLYAFYHDCDPVLSGTITKSDQMIPLFTLQTLGHLPGVPGIFMSCISSACLSSLSSIQPSVAAIWLRDIIMPLYKLYHRRPMSPALGKNIARGLSLLIGLMTIGMAFAMVEARNSDLFALSNMIGGVLLTPMACLFMMGLMFKYMNTLSAISGASVGLTVSLWLGIGRFLYPRAPELLHRSTHGCPAAELTTQSLGLHNATVFLPVYDSLLLTSTNNTQGTGFQWMDVYKLPHTMYAVVGTVLTFAVALLVHGIQSCFCKWTQKNYTNASSISHLKGEAEVELQLVVKNKLFEQHK